MTAQWFVYDLETGTAERGRYNPILQFGGIKHRIEKGADKAGQFKADGTMEMRVRGGGHYLSPVALAVNGLGGTERDGVDSLEAAQEMYAAIGAQRIGGSGEGVFVGGYNVFGFDDNVLRHWLFANGESPWLLRSDFDAMMILRMGYAMESPAVSVTIGGRGQPEFSLASLCEANGIALENAHDALADVEGSMALVDKLMREDPATFERLMALHAPGSAEEAAEGKLIVGAVSAMGGMKPLQAFKGADGGNYAVELDQPARLEKFMALSLDEVQGMMAKDPSERPKGWQSASGSNVPMRRMKAPGPVLYVPYNTESLTPPLKGLAKHADKVAESMDIVEAHGAQAVFGRVEAALSGRPQYERAPGVESRGLDLKLSDDDHTHRRNHAMQCLDAQKSKNWKGLPSLVSVAGMMSGDRHEHLQLFALWRGDRGARFDDPREALVYSAALEDRFRKTDNEPPSSCIDMAEAEVEKLRTGKKADLFLEAGEMIEAGLERAKVMDRYRQRMGDVAQRAEAMCGLNAEGALAALTAEADAEAERLAAPYREMEAGPGLFA